MEWYGKVNPVVYDGKLYYELLLQQNIIDDLLSENEDSIQISESIIMHELFHW